MFYLHQLTVNVFNIHDLATGKRYYRQGIGKKGPHEVCSFIKNCIDLYVPLLVTHFSIQSDGCGGRNKNHTLIQFCAVLTKLGRFDTINQNHAICGHSFMPCDRNFAVVKRQICMHDRMYTLKQYVEPIISTNKKKFTVHLVENNWMIKDFKDWWPKYYKRNTLSKDSFGRNVPKDEKIKFNISAHMHLTHKYFYLYALNP